MACLLASAMALAPPGKTVTLTSFAVDWKELGCASSLQLRPPRHAATSVVHTRALAGADDVAWHEMGFVSGLRLRSTRRVAKVEEPKRATVEEVLPLAMPRPAVKKLKLPDLGESVDSFTGAAQVTKLYRAEVHERSPRGQ